MIFFRSLLAGLALAVLTSGAALAQCGTTAPANRFCGNDTGSQALAQWRTVPTGALTPIGPGTVLGNPTGASAPPIATSTPALGVPSTSQGTLTFYGGTSGAVLLVPQAVAGSPVLTFPNTSGTFAIGATAPLSLNASTGTLSIPGLAGAVLAGAGPAFTMTPALGATGVATGSLAFNAFTSGSVVITPQSVAGTPVLTFPNTSGTFAVNATSPLVLSATTGGLTCPTCVTSSGGGAITGVAPVAVSAAGAVSITGLAGGVLAGSGPAFTRTPVLGVAGSAVGSLGFQNATSGTVTLQPVTGALGTVTINVPAAAGTLAVSASAPIVLSATGNLTCCTGNTAIAGTLTVTSNSASALMVGANGATNPVLQIDASVGSVVTGVRILGANAGNAVSITTISSATDERLFINAKGTGIIQLGQAQVAPTITVAGSSGTSTLNVGSTGVSGGLFVIAGSTSGSTSLAAASAASGALTLPSATDTLIGKATTDTFTNKTYNAQGTGNVFQLDGVTVTGKAANADYLAGTSTAKLISPSVIYQTPTGTTFAASITFDMSTFIDTAVTLTGNITTMTLSNVIAGKAGTIGFIQDGTGNRTTVWSTTFKFAGGVTPVLSTAANAVDILNFSCRSTTFCTASLMKDVK